MEIHFKNIDGRNVAKALVEIPDQILNDFMVRANDVDRYVNIPHIKNGVFTRIVGDAAVSFLEESDKLPMPSKKEAKIYTVDEVGQTINTQDLLRKFRERPTELITTMEGTLIKLGFEKRGPAKWWCPFFGIDLEENWMDFDPHTDQLPFIIAKLFRSGYAKGRREVRLEIKKALDISPT